MPEMNQNLFIFPTSREDAEQMQIEPFTLKMTALERVLCQTDNFSFPFVGDVKSMKETDVFFLL